MQTKCILLQQDDTSHVHTGKLGEASAKVFTLFYAGTFPTFPRNEQVTLKWFR